MLIRLLDESNDLTDLRRCAIEIQDFERTMVPTRPSGESICTEYMTQMLDTCKKYAGFILVAIVNEQVAGYVSVFTRMVSHEIIDGNEEFGQIGDLVVLEQFRGRGVGRQLMEEAQELARANGVSDLRIGVLGQNETAISLYRSLGFDVFSLELQKRI